MAIVRGAVALTQDTPTKVSTGIDRKNHTWIHVASGDVYIADNAATLATATNGWKVPTTPAIKLTFEGDIWAVTTDANATINVWDE